MIRHADPAGDAAACAATYGFYVAETVASFDEVPLGQEEMRERIERTSATHPWLVAEDPQGRVVGYAYGSQHRERASYRWACDVAVYVDHDQRGRGVGHALYAALLPLLREQRFHVACAGITLPNDASVRLHESFGFEPVGVYREIGWKAGAWHDVGWWQLQLSTDDTDQAAPPEPLAPPRR